MLERLKRLDILRCSECEGNIIFLDDYLECQVCFTRFPIQNGVPFFSKKNIDTKGSDTSEEKLILKSIKEKFPFLSKLNRLLRPPSFNSLIRGENRLNVYVEQAVKNPDAVILDLGSGGNKIAPEVISIDIYNYPGVDLCMRADKICLKDNSVDMIISTSAIEHMTDTGRVFQEMQRILKPDGIIFITAPFIYPYHPEPFDFQRWSADGLKKAFPVCDCLESGRLHGPHLAIYVILSSYFAWMFSFGFYPVYLLLFALLQWIFLPFKILDNLHGIYQKATPLDCIVYYVGRKK
jgi:SAM-dependent methyltransferase